MSVDDVEIEIVRSPPETTADPLASGARERSFPLIALIQLATFLAAMVACIDGKKLSGVLEDSRRDPLVPAIVVAVVCGGVGLLGFVVGMGQLRMWRSALAGGGVGMLYGLAILAVYAAPASIERALAATAVLAATTIAFRVRAA